MQWWRNRCWGEVLKSQTGVCEDTGREMCAINLEALLWPPPGIGASCSTFPSQSNTEKCVCHHPKEGEKHFISPVLLLTVVQGVSLSGTISKVRMWGIARKLDGFFSTTTTLWHRPWGIGRAREGRHRLVWNCFQEIKNFALRKWTYGLVTVLTLEDALNDSESISLGNRKAASSAEILSS